MRVQMGDAEQYRDSGTVIAVRDVSNTFREATIEFWTDVCSNTVNSIRGKLHTNLDTNVTQAGNAASGDVSGLKTALVAGGVAASVGATTLVGFEALVPALAVVAGGLTLFNVVDYARTKNRLDKAPVYHAIGVTLNECERVRWPISSRVFRSPPGEVRRGTSPRPSRLAARSARPAAEDERIIPR